MPETTEKMSSQTPAALGYRMPAEWEPHAATWLAWPHNDITWPEEKKKQVRDVYFQMLAALLPVEKVNLLVASEDELEEVVFGLQRRAVKSANLQAHLRPTVDAWIRDYGPTFLKDASGNKAWCKWIFNAWGSKYEDLMLDTHVFEKAEELVPYPCFDAGFVLEGGSIEVNGVGTCLVTEQCLLNPNRNPSFTREQIEVKLRQYLGVSQILWIKEGVAGDDTDGHIDDIVRFAGPRLILSAYEEDSTDENFAVLQHNWETLKALKTPEGKPWDLMKLPMPERLEREGDRLPASYANFYIANGVVLAPVFGHKNDDRAVNILRQAFPTREIIPIRAETLVYGFGAIHCVSQQEPA